MRKILNFLILCIWCGSLNLISQITLPPFYKSGMVLPREIQIPLSGKASANARLSIEIDQKAYSVRADKNGEWQVLIQPLKVGGPYSLNIQSDKDSALELIEILAGDLWLCAGQSNMQYTLNMLNYQDTETDEYILPNLRLCSISVDTDYIPKSEVKSATWSEVNRESARNFSAVGYYFGKFISENQNVPIGLISSNLGATAIETWMSMDALRQIPSFNDITRYIAKINKPFALLEDEFAVFRERWDKKYYLKGPGIDEKWQSDNYDFSDWETCTLPSFWDDFGFENHDGSIWFKRTFDLDNSQLNQELPLHLNQIDDYDRVWVNGEFVGETFGKSNFRNYVVPKEILREKGNVITVRVFDVGGKGGIYTNAFWGNPILNGTWHFKKGIAINSKKFPTPIVPNGSPFSHPMLLYNGSIAPLHKIPITGVIWYQGESNVTRAVEYESLLKAMIGDWRKKWEKQDLPFLVVQLANYKAEAAVPDKSEWAELRESQMKASELENVDIVSAIDIGDAQDIHPYNKKEVGRRLALLAEHYAYNQILKKGPVYESSERSASSIIITFKTYGSKLKSLNKYGYLNGFAIAGEDGTFQWAKAKIISDYQVEVYNENLPSPKFVRYAWADNPGELNLVDQNGLPAYPFRTDALPLSTEKNQFSYDPNAF